MLVGSIIGAAKLSTDWQRKATYSNVKCFVHQLLYLLIFYLILQRWNCLCISHFNTGSKYLSKYFAICSLGRSTSIAGTTVFYIFNNYRPTIGQLLHNHSKSVNSVHTNTSDALLCQVTISCCHCIIPYSCIYIAQVDIEVV